MLYRITSLAERSPQLLEALDMRRVAHRDSLEQGFDRLWSGLSARAVKSVDTCHEGALAGFRSRLSSRKFRHDEQLRILRDADSVNVRHLRFEMEAEQHDALEDQRKALELLCKEKLEQARKMCSVDGGVHHISSLFAGAQRTRG